MKISIICATIGPYDQILSLIKSIDYAVAKESHPFNVEFILVDQSNSHGVINFSSSDRLVIIHIKNKNRGLSRNRNIGLTRVTGEWVTFIDSDCVLPENYFNNLARLINENPHVDHFLGRIIGFSSGNPLFRAWPKMPIEVSNLGIWYYATSVNSIFKIGQKINYFDEDFGLGEKYGSCEDIDFFLNLKTTKLYSPELVVRHPDFTAQELPREKLDSYSFGFGALCAKHALPFGVFILLLSVLKKAVDVLRSRSTTPDLLHAWNFRFKGFCHYMCKKRRILNV